MFLFKQIFFVVILIVPFCSAKKLKIGIVGAGISILIVSTFLKIFNLGIGGSSAAYFLSQELAKDENEVDVTVFEKNEVGGRIASVEISGQIYDTGGIFFHELNKLISHFVDVCNMKSKKFLMGKVLSVFDGHQLHYNVPISSGFSVVYEHLKLIWKFGPFQLLKLLKLYQNTVHDMVNFYDILQSGEGYHSVKDLLENANPEFVKLTSISFEDYLINEIGLDEQIVNELVSVFTRLIYGQKPSTIHSFAGALLLIGLDFESVLGVEGGNVKIAECALESSGAKLVRKEVKKISKVNQQYKVNDLEELFDILIIASPLTADKSNLLFVGFDEEITIPGSYIPITATIVQGKLNTTSLVIHDNMKTTFYYQMSENFPLWSIERTDTNSDDEDENAKPVYRMHSHGPLSEEFLKTIFVSINEVSRTDWLAVPRTDINPNLGSFELSDGLYYINRIEMALSAMEFSIAGAKNVVNLIRKKHFDKTVQASYRTEL